MKYDKIAIIVGPRGVTSKSTLMWIDMLKGAGTEVLIKEVGSHVYGTKFNTCWFDEELPHND
jgi:hypothetical protein